MSALADRCAIVTGVSGQDGAYLSRILINADVHVIGTTRHSVENDDLLEKMTSVQWDLQDQSVLADMLTTFRPAYFFNLAAFSSGRDMNKSPLDVAAINGFSVVEMLETIRHICPTAHFKRAGDRQFDEIVGINRLLRHFHGFRRP